MNQIVRPAVMTIVDLAEFRAAICTYTEQLSNFTIDWEPSCQFELVCPEGKKYASEIVAIQTSGSSFWLRDAIVTVSFQVLYDVIMDFVPRYCTFRLGALWNKEIKEFVITEATMLQCFDKLPSSE